MPLEDQEKERFLSRWARLKKEAETKLPEPPRPAAVEEAVPNLPPLESLTPESDFSAFLHPKVDEALKRAALKKLFSDPRFNIMDRLDVYIDDYGQPDPIPPEMLKRLNQYINLVQGGEEKAKEAEAQEKPGEAPPGDGVRTPPQLAEFDLDQADNTSDSVLTHCDKPLNEK